MTLAPRYWDELCADIVTRFVVLLSARSCSAVRQLHGSVRAGYASSYAGRCELCVQQWCGWGLGHAPLSFERRGVVH